MAIAPGSTYTVSGMPQQAGLSGGQQSGGVNLFQPGGSGLTGGGNTSGGGYGGQTASPQAVGGQQIRPINIPAGSNSNQSTSTQQSSTQVLPQLQQNYQQLLAMNQQNYGNVLSAYTQGQNRQNQELPGIYQGYGQLQGDVANTMGMGAALGQNGNWGVAQPAADAINRTYQGAQAGTTQQMANAGLGNTTAVGNFQGQNAYNAAQSYGNLGAQLAGQYANQQMGIGLAGQGAQMQGMQSQAQLAAQRGGALAGYNFANTAGNLTGQFSSGSSQSSGAGLQYPPGYGGLTGQISNQAQQDRLNPANINGTGGGGVTGSADGGGTAGGGGGGGTTGGGGGGLAGYDMSGQMNQQPNYQQPGMTNQNPGGFSYGQNWGPAGQPGTDMTGQMNQQPNYGQPGMTDTNPGGFSAGQTGGYGTLASGSVTGGGGGGSGDTLQQAGASPWNQSPGMEGVEMSQGNMDLFNQPATQPGFQNMLQQTTYQKLALKYGNTKANQLMGK